VGAIGAPLVGVAGATTAIPMAFVIAVSGSGAVAAYLLQARR
jgi:hypothetical protein